MQVHRIIGFTPTLLQIATQNDIDLPVRQAAAVYLKNEINSNWQDKDESAAVPIAYSIHEQDRAMVRDGIVEAIALTPELIRYTLWTRSNLMLIKYDKFAHVHTCHCTRK